MLDQLVATREQLPVKESTDSRTIVACQRGDREALHLLFEDYKDRVYSIAIYSLGGDEMAAADVTQQVFLKLMTRIGQFRGDSEFATCYFGLLSITFITDLAKRNHLFCWPICSLKRAVVVNF